MNKLDIRNIAPAEIMEMMTTLAPGVGKALARSEHIKCKMYPYQGALLYWLAQQYNQDGARIVEIGTLHGYSASIMAQAAPRAHITTLNPTKAEVLGARVTLADYRNVTIIDIASWDYYPAAPVNIEMVFVDGDHKRAARDLPWWNVIAFGGLMAFHDYSPVKVPPVAVAVDRLCAQLKKAAPDVVVIDDAGVGMAGIYKDAYIGWPGVR